MCLMSTRSEADREEGRETLRQWKGYENEEPELGFRLMQLLLYGLTHQVDKSEGRELHERLQQRLTERMKYDRSAEDLLYSLTVAQRVSIPRTSRSNASTGRSATTGRTETRAPCDGQSSTTAVWSTTAAA